MSDPNEVTTGADTGTTRDGSIAPTLLEVADLLDQIGDTQGHGRADKYHDAADACRNVHRLNRTAAARVRELEAENARIRQELEIKDALIGQPTPEMELSTTTGNPHVPAWKTIPIISHTPCTKCGRTDIPALRIHFDGDKVVGQFCWPKCPEDTETAPQEGEKGEDSNG